MTASFNQNPDGTLQADANKFELFCAGQKVGTCLFDMGVYKGKTPAVERASIVPLDAPETGQLVLRGDPNVYPGAFIEFRITVMAKGSPEETKKIQAIDARRRSSVLSKGLNLQSIQELSAS